MATRKKKVKAKSKPKTKKPAARKPKAKAKKTKKKAAAPKFDAASTQQIAIAEIVGDIEERMALDRLAEPTS